MLAVVRILELVSSTGKPLSALVAEVDRYPRTGELNFHIDDKDGAIKRLEATFKDAQIYHLDGVTIRYADWWCNVRKSNTEPLLRLNLEADTPAVLENARARVVEAIGGVLEH
jgi:phosphomannomutase